MNQEYDFNSLELDSGAIQSVLESMQLFGASTAVARSVLSPLPFDDVFLGHKTAEAETEQSRALWEGLAGTLISPGLVAPESALRSLFALPYAKEAGALLGSATPLATADTGSLQPTRSPSAAPAQTAPQQPASKPANTNKASPGTEVSLEDRRKLDEERRRRNTEASARFRMKKKLREKDMVQAFKEANDKVHELSARVGELERENRLLRELVSDKRSTGFVERAVKRKAGYDDDDQLSFSPETAQLRALAPRNLPYF